jgi:polysaccharide export outer membrane protein
MKNVRWGCLALAVSLFVATLFVVSPLCKLAYAQTQEAVAKDAGGDNGAVDAAAAGENDTASKAKAHEEETAGSYRIGKGDVLEINVWKEPILSGETIVRSDGMVSLTLIGDVQAAGRTPMELRDDIQKRLVDYVEDPTVSILLKAQTSQKYYVIGEVKLPGEYDLVKDLNIVQAIARAGGFGEWADKDDIIVLRTLNGVEQRIKVDYKEIVKGVNTLQNIPIQASDTIIIP